MQLIQFVHPYRSAEYFESAVKSFANATTDYQNNVLNKIDTNELVNYNFLIKTIDT